MIRNWSIHVVFFVSVADMFVFVDKGHKAQHQFLSTALYYFNIFKAENLQAYADTKSANPGIQHENILFRNYSFELL